MQKRGGIVWEKRRNRENQPFFQGCADGGRKRAISVAQGMRGGRRGRLRYVLFSHAAKKVVDGGGGVCYTVIWYFTVLVWLSWQSSSLVMSRSPVRIRPQAPDSSRTPRGVFLCTRTAGFFSLTCTVGWGMTNKRREGIPCGVCFFMREAGGHGNPFVAEEHQGRLHRTGGQFHGKTSDRFLLVLWMSTRRTA